MSKAGSPKLSVPARLAGLCKLAVFGFAATLAPLVFGQAPPNDNFASATQLTGDFGTITDNNRGATAEAGEPNHAGQRARASLWYKWTASYDGAVEFDTFNSRLDTVLAVYTGSDVAHLDFLVANDDANGPYAGMVLGQYTGPSGVKFRAKRGTTYYIAVDGYGGATGAITLSWAYNSSGVFRFTSDTYSYSERESIMPQSATVGWSAPGARITVTRLFGASGKVIVHFDFKDGTASEGTDFLRPGNTNLVFEDYEMSKSFTVPLISSPLCQPDRTFQIILTGADLDPLEDATVLSPPRVEQPHGTTTVTILDHQYDPNLGCLAGNTNPSIANFERSVFRTSESITNRVDTGARIFVHRLGGNTDQGVEIHYTIDCIPPLWSGNTRDNTFDLQAGSDYAAPDPHDGPDSNNPDFALPYPLGSYGTVAWGPGDTAPKPIDIQPYKDYLPEFNEDLRIRLTQVPGHNNDLVPGEINEATLTILYEDYPAGALDETHNVDFSLATDPPNNSQPGANSTVNALVVQPDDKTIVAGNFSSYNATPRYGIARINLDGSNDRTFNPGGGVAVKQNEFISCLALAGGGKVALGGKFTSYNNNPRYNIARINGDGSLDTGFNPGLGANGSVWSVAVQSDGKVLLGGDFTTVNGYPRSHIARLNNDGSVDISFDPGLNALDGAVDAIAIAPDGSIYIGGEFATVGGVARHSVALLNTNGVLATSFNPGTGADGPVYALAIQGDGKLLIGGSFGIVQLINRNNIARLNRDGSLDTTFDPGTGTDDDVYSILMQNDGRILIAGLFNEYNETRRVTLARIFGTGELDTSFMDTAYNQFAGPHKIYFNPYVNPKDFLTTIGLQSDGNLMIGGSFGYVGGGRQLSLAMTNNAYPIDQISGNYYPVGQSRATYRIRNNVARLLGGDTTGPGSMALEASSYNVDENMSYLYVKMVRTNGTLGTIESTFSLPPRAAGPGVAQSGTDYVYNDVNPFWDTSWDLPSRAWSDGLYGTNNDTFTVLPGRLVNTTLDDVYVTIYNRSGYQGDRYVPFKLDMPSSADVFYLGGENIPLGSALARSTSTLEILEDAISPGALGFSSPVYYVNENATNASITLTRTNGANGMVYVTFATTNGTAISGKDYSGRTNTVIFGDGVTTVTNVLVPVNNDSTVQTADKTVNLYLANPGNGATLGLSKATLYIVDDDFLAGHINFQTTTYVTDETAGAVTLMVTRSGGNQGVLNLQFATSNFTAIANTDYMPTNGVLHWDDKDITPRFITVQVVHDGLVGPNKQFMVNLFDDPKTPGALGPRSTASVTILNVDQYGSLQFTAPSYVVSENGGYATITVVRVGGSAETVSADFSTSDGTAYTSFNYFATNGTLVFGPGEVSKSFTVPLINDGVQDSSPFFLNVALANFLPVGASPGFPIDATINIVDAQSVTQPAGVADTDFQLGFGFNDDVLSIALQPDGKILAGGNFTTANGLAINRIARLNADGNLDLTFLSGLAGANDVVRTVINQSDTRIVLGGSFSTINLVNRGGLARLNYDGTLDTGFNPGSGADGVVYALAETFDLAGPRKLMVAGSFNTFNGTLRSGIVRLNDDGTVDPSFINGAGANGAVYAVAVYPTNSLYPGRIVIGGDFTSVNGIARNRIARLNLDGTVDTSFDPGDGASDIVRALGIQTDGKVVIGGAFTNVNGTILNRLARLNGDGSVDADFQAKLAPGANDAVYALAIQPDNRIVVGGQFTTANGVTRNRITRLMSDGRVDPTINFGSGANNFVASLALQPDGMILLAGGFTEVQGLSRPHLARLYGASMTGSGSFRFDSALYTADETGTNAIITVLRDGGTSGPRPDGTGEITVQFTTSDGTGVQGINYSNVTTTLHFPAGETVQTVAIPLRDDQQITPDLTVNLALSNPDSPATLGAQPTALLTIANIDSAVTFSAPAYSRAENAIDGAATIHIVRQGGLENQATVVFNTTTGGTAIPGVNYTPVTNVLITFLPSETDQIVKIPLFHTPQAEGDTTVTMQLSTPAGTLLGQPSQATLTIVDVDQAPGQFMFSTPSYLVGEGDGNAYITIVRTNGRSGDVSIDFNTVPGTATPGLKYSPTNGTLSFANGETVKTVAVPILEESQVEGGQYFSFVLSNPRNGTSILGSDTAQVTINDDDIGVSFASAVYVSPDTNVLVTIDVIRTGGSNLVTEVDYTTADGSAVSNINYGATSGTLRFNVGETRKSISVPVFHDPRVTGNLTFTMNLLNPKNGAQLTMPASAIVSIQDIDTGLSFFNPSTNPPPDLAQYTVNKNGTNVVISVLRTNASTGRVVVNYATSDDTAVAANGDYVPASGFLVFANGQTSNSFRVTINNNDTIQGDKSFNVRLFNASAPAQLLTPNNAAVTIIDNEAGFRFTSPTYNVMVDGVFATVGVQRIGYTNSTVSLNYFTQDGTARQGTDYDPVSGTLLFTNGETTKSFQVPIRSTTILQPDKTVLLGLSNAVGFATFVDPSAATLTIHNANGSLIVPAGSALIGEPAATRDGAIQPGETVTLLFAFRNSAGTNTANMTATLLATSGITSPSDPANYGVLTVGGASVSRPFTFTASGTNGQHIVATFLLQDNGKNIGTNTFTYTIGTTTSTFANTAPITINDYSPAAPPYTATPYGSVLNVNGVDGVIRNVTVTINNLNHRSSSDVGLLLVPPTGQTNVLLMANAGGNGVAINRAVVTFDDTAANSLPQFTVITNGSYKPTGYPAVPLFPVPAPTLPYGSTLSVLSGLNPNNDWKLYVIDDSAVDGGIISNGWSLKFTTVKPVESAADVGLTMAVLDPAPPQSVIATSNLVYSLTVANYGPGSSTNIVVTNLVPGNARFVSATPSQGTIGVTGKILTWTVPTLGTNGTATLLLTVQPTNTSGSVSNYAVVSSTTTDLNPDDNSASAMTGILPPTADLSLTAFAAPDPVLTGGRLVFTFGVSNTGPATAVNVMFTNRLPASFQLVSVVPSQGVGGPDGNTAWASLDNLGAHQQATVLVTVQPMAGGIFTNTASITNDVRDPFKANNSASAKSLVQDTHITVSRAGNALTIVWPDYAGSVVEMTTNLLEPHWVLVPVDPQINGGQRTIQIPITETNSFFRFSVPTP